MERMRSGSGLSLVEVIIATLLLSTMIGGIFFAFTSSSKWTNPQDSTDMMGLKGQVEVGSINQDWNLVTDPGVFGVDVNGDGNEDYRRIDKATP